MLRLLLFFKMVYKTETKIFPGGNFQKNKQCRYIKKRPPIRRPINFIQYSFYLPPEYHSLFFFALFTHHIIERMVIFMKTMFETLDVMWNLNDDGNIDVDRPLIIACKDREATKKGEDR